MRHLLVPLLLASTLGHAQPKILRISIMDEWTMPMAQIKDGQLTGGVIHTLMLRLAGRVDSQPEFRVMPRMRMLIAQRRREIDLRCYLSEPWSRPDPAYLLSQPVHWQRDLLIGLPDKPVDLSFTPAQPRRIGTVFNHLYPSLQDYFENGSLIRDDARTPELAIQKLLAGRYALAVVSAPALAWFQRQNHHGPHPKILRPLSRLALRCLVRDSDEVPAADILRTLDDMHRSGEIEQIEAAYR